RAQASGRRRVDPDPTDRLRQVHQSAFAGRSSGPEGQERWRCAQERSRYHRAGARARNARGGTVGGQRLREGRVLERIAFERACSAVLTPLADGSAKNERRKTSPARTARRSIASAIRIEARRFAG